MKNEHDSPSFGQQAQESSKLLISVIKKLTSSSSGDQRELEKINLEKAFEESGSRVDTLLKEHQQDVAQSLGVFRQVSNEIILSRQRVSGVKNALQTCKILLANRRDELKKLWKESEEQRMICEILDQIEETKHIDVKINQLLKECKYHEASETLKRAEILLNGPLSTIEGLSSGIANMSKKLFEEITVQLLELVVIQPFELSILELIRANQSELMIMESAFCSQLLEKYATFRHSVKSTSGSGIGDELEIRKKITDAVEALSVFDNIGAAFEHLFMRVPGICIRSINYTVLVLQLLAKSGATDRTHFVQLIKLMIQQVRSASQRMDMVVAEVVRLRGPTDESIGGSVSKLRARFWGYLQDVFEQCLSEHFCVWRHNRLANADNHTLASTGNGEKLTHKQQSLLFSFGNTSFVGTSTANSFMTKRQLNTICSASIYNIVPVFHLINFICSEIELQLNAIEVHCQLRTFLHTFAMENFMETVRANMEIRMENVLAGSANPWTTQNVPTHSVKLLTSCVKVFELCEEIATHINAIDPYTQRFASLWFLIIAYYGKIVTDQYSQILHTRSNFFAVSQQFNVSEIDNSMTSNSNFGDTSLVEYPSSKISASWAADEDISRLLKTLPGWTRLEQLAQTPSAQTPFSQLHPQNSFSVDETSIRFGAIGLVNDNDQKYARESELLISNLGQHKQIQKQEIITNMDHVKALICIHESLRWFDTNMRQLLSGLSDKAREIVRCRIQFSSPNGQTVEQVLCDALEENIASLDRMSETSLLILYLELRIHCFFHLLPLTRNIASNASHQDTDKQIREFGQDLAQLNRTLQMYTDPVKLHLLFDGLSHLCAQILIHSAQHINRLSESARKQLQRAIFGMQKTMFTLSGRRPETDLARAQIYYDLLSKDPDQIIAHITERELSFSQLEYTNLVSLSVRSHPILCSQPGALESRTAKLKEILNQKQR